VARITRKELKTDKFALEVEHSISFFEEHQKSIIRYGGIAIVLVVLILGYRYYARQQQTQRELTLARAMLVRDTPIGPINPTGPPAFPTQQVKEQAITKAFTDLKAKYPGSQEAMIADYYMASQKADAGDLAGAEKAYQEVAEKGDAQYASLAKLSLAQIYFGEGKNDQARKMLEDLIAHPTVFVSKEQASLALARGLMPTNPAEARKILDPLRTQQGPAGQVALQMYGELPAK
jgi:predicted negative regulator of RcsB-dependent stress response